MEKTNKEIKLTIRTDKETRHKLRMLGADADKTMSAYFRDLIDEKWTEIKMAKVAALTNS